MSSVEFFIGKRYLFSKRSIRFVNIITMISIAGITIGVAALLIVLSVFNGFNDIVTQVLISFDPHLRIEKPGGLNQSEQDVVKTALSSQPKIKGVAPFISGKALLISGNKNIVAYIKGIDSSSISSVSGLKESIVLGSLILQDSGRVDGIVLGIALADRLGCNTGDYITLISPNDVSFNSYLPPSSHRLRVTGIFSASNKDYDASYAFIDLKKSQDIFRMAGKISGFEARTDDYTLAEDIKKDLQKVNLSGGIVSTWQDLHKDLYFVMKLERWSGYVILSLIIAVACFNLMGSLAMSVIEKRRDIGTLQAMGLSPERITKSFILEGLLVGVIGTSIGILLGLFILFLQIKYQLFALDTSVYIIPAIPVKIELMDFFTVSIASLGLSWLAAYLPARKISLIEPAEAIRWE